MKIVNLPTFLSVALLLAFSSLTYGQISVSAPTHIRNYPPTYGTWIQDPLQTTGAGKVWVIPSYFTNTVYEYASISALLADSISQTYTLPQSFAGTGHVVYGGNLYYNRFSSNNLVKYNLTSQTVLLDVPLPGAGSMNTYPYNWGGYSDIDFETDESGLWVMYSTAANSSKLVVSKLNPLTLEVTSTWNTNSEPKQSMGNAFMSQGIVYCIDDYNQLSQNINYTFNTNTSTGSSALIPWTNGSGYMTSCTYNPTTGLLFSWNNGGLYQYSVTHLTTSTVTTADSLALVSLYNSTNGASWFNKTNWLTGNVNTWYGITVANNRVTEINLAANNLGSVFPNLSNLTGLKKLDLGANNFNIQPMPASLNNLTSLEYLDLRNNRFSGIITSLDGLDSLKYLSLSNNTFLNNQIFPAFVLGLGNLETLLLNNCRLQLAIPAGLSNLTHLKELNLSANLGLSLIGPPLEELGTLQEMRVLNLSGVGLGGILTTAIASLPNLINLNVSSSSLTALPTNSAWVSDSLQVNISNNLLDFGDLEPLVGIASPTFINTGQGPFQLYLQGAGTVTRLLEGDLFLITPVVNGTQNSYQWYFNNAIIPGATNLTLDLGNLEISESGIYRLQVTSSLVTGITLTSINQTLTVVAGAESRFTKVTGSVIGNEVQSNSNGGYWGDMDNDGDEDLFVNNSFVDIPNFLYENLGDGTFGKITTGDIVNVIDGPRYASWGDYDNDGYADIFVGEYTNANLSPTNDNISSLYHNNGDKTFTRIPINHKADGGLWADYDNDGDLDLFLNATTINPTAAKLYKNNGGGNFELIDNWVPVNGTWYAGFVDIDHDGDLDYNITPGTASNQIKIFRNNSGTFVEENLPIPAGNFSHRGSSWGDIDGDGDMDLFAMNASVGASGFAESQFYMNDGAGNFTMQAASTRLGVPAWGGRGSSFADADNDGDLDLFVIHRPTITSDLITQLFLNNGSGMFTAVPQSEQSFGFSDPSTGLSLADYNNDGAQDLFIGSFDPARPNYLFRNLQGSNGNNWLKLKLVGVESNKTAIGARIDFFVGGQRFNRQILPSSGLSGQNSYIVHSGLAGSIKADSVVINWPSGSIERLLNVQANQLLTVIEGLSDDPSVTTADSLALVSLYNSTNGASWTNKTNWLTGKVNTWYGITVDSSRVTGINLVSNHLMSVLPDLSNLTALKNLSLSNNTFLNPQVFPAFVLGLENLETLLLNNCRLQGAIPAGFSNLTHLNELNLSGNLGLGLSGAPLEELGALQEMEVLNLSGVGLGGNLSTAIASLPNLTDLNVSNSALTGLPANSAWVNDSLLVNISNNLLDFGDLEPLVGISNPTFINTGQLPFPLFPQGLGNTKLLEGDPFILTPVVNGTQNSYQWYVNNAPIPGATNLTLDLGNLELSETGTYRLQVTSSLVTGITLISTNQVLTVVVGVESRYAKVTNSVIGNEVQSNSNGGYWADMDNDGDEDLFVNNSFNDIPNFLYENLGDGTFGKITSGDIVNVIDGPRYSSWGDYDNDGYPDIFVGEYTNANLSPTNDNISSLYHNNGNKTFTRIPFNHKSDGSLWADYDNDGDLDLIINTTNILAPATKLYKNNGGGNFELIDNWVPVSGTWYSGFVDIDLDGDLDYNTTPGTASNQIKIFRNNGGTFEEENLPIPSGGFSHRGSSWGDIDGDGDMDLFAMNASPSGAESQFYINNGAGNFTMQAASTRLGVPAWGARGSSFADTDNDGDLDLFVIHRPSISSVDIIPQLFLNNGSGMFTAVPQSEQSFSFSDLSTGLSVADYDNDGAQDLFIGSFDPARPNYLYRNLQGSNGNNWLKLKLVGTLSNKTAIGARVDFFVGGQRFNRQILPSSGLSGQNSYIVHSGLAGSTQADSIVIHWPSGVTQQLRNVPANQQVTVIEGSGELIPTTLPIVITSVNSYPLTDYQVKVIVATDSLIDIGRMKSDGSDARFTDTNGNQLSFWLESGVNSISTIYWVKVPLIPANGETTIYLKCGDPLATQASNGYTTFINFDDFERDSLSSWIFQGGTWTIATVGNNHVLNVSNPGFGTGSPAVLAESVPLNEYVVETDYFPINNDSYGGPLFEFNDLQNYYAIHSMPDSDVIMHSKIQNGNPDYGLNWFYPHNNGQWFNFRAERTGSVNKIYFNHAFIADLPITFSSGAGVWAYAGPSNFDNVRVRKFADVVPNASVGQPIENPTVPASNIAFSNVLTTSMDVSFTAGNGTNRLAVMKQGSAPSFIPLDNVNYSGDVGLGETVVYNGDSTAFALTNLSPDTEYFITVFEYNNGNKYLVAGAPVDSQRTLVQPNVYVTSPADSASNLAVTLNVTARALTGATTYTIELNEAFDFTGNGFVKSGSRTQNFTGLSYATRYYTRVKTNLSPAYGRITTFHTRIPNIYVTTPADSAINLATTLNVTAAALTGATLYTIELNESYDFSGVGFVQTGSRVQSFTGLKNNQRYYTRVKTDVYPVYGPITSFTTALPNVYVTTPANNAVNQNVTLNVTARALTGATVYTIELNENVNFSGAGFVQTGARTQSFTGLSFGTQYFARVKTDLSPVYGIVTSFNTINASSIAYVTTPANNAVNVNNALNISSNNVPGATQYTIQLSESIGFDTIAFEMTGPTRTLAFSGLKYNTRYYNRVITNVTPVPGQVRSFTTQSAATITFVISPANNAANVNTALNISSSNVPGAVEYTIQLSRSASFDTIAFEVTGPTRTLAFSGLRYNTKYYNRVRTNLSASDSLGGWGAIRSFTTRTAESIAFVTSPTNGAINRNTNLNITTNSVPGATQYTIQLSETAGFDTVKFERIGSSRTLAFSGLKSGTTYFNRVTTNAPGTIGFGQVRSFTTVGVPPGARMSSSSTPDQVMTEELKEFDVQVYPNPFHENLIFHIEARVEKQASVTLMDVNGKVMHESMEQTNTTVEIDKPLAVGVYLLRVTAGTQYKMIRVVKSE